MQFPSCFSSLSSTDVGFILVIDRRQDRWAAVKGTLLRIAVSLRSALPVVVVVVVVVCSASALPGETRRDVRRGEHQSLSQLLD